MTRGLAGGPYGDPSRFDMGGNRAVYANESPDSEDPQILAADAVDDAEVFSGKFERAISIFRCAYSWVGHARPQVDGRYGVVWFGQYAPHASGASAVYAGVGDVPSVYGVGSLYRASLEASYWVHAVLGNWCNRFFVHTIGDIKAKQDELESSAFTAHVKDFFLLLLYVCILVVARGSCHSVDHFLASPCQVSDRYENWCKCRFSSCTFVSSILTALFVYFSFCISLRRRLKTK